MCELFACVAIPLLVLASPFVFLNYGGTSLVDFRAIRRLLRNPRFGIVGLMGATASVAVALTLTRWLGIPLDHPGSICFILPMLLVAVAIVSSCFLAWDDLFANRRFRDLRNKISDTPEFPTQPESSTEQVNSEGISERADDQDEQSGS